jgi:acyl carrier protein
MQRTPELPAGKERAVTLDSRRILLSVQDAIREQLGLGAGVPVPPDAEFYGEIGGDSLDLAEIVMNLEAEFDISAPESAVPPPITPRRLAGMIE